MIPILPARDIKMVTVILDNSSPDELKDFRCTKCGKIIFQYYTELKVIIIGETREVVRPYDILCKIDKTMYRIT